MEVVGPSAALLVQNGNSWRPAVVLDCDDDIVVTYSDGTFEPLRGRRFVVQRPVRTLDTSPGNAVLVDTLHIAEDPDERDAARSIRAVAGAAFVQGVCVPHRGDATHVAVLVGSPGRDYRWSVQHTPKCVQGVSGLGEASMHLHNESGRVVHVPREGVFCGLDWRVCRGNGPMTMALAPDVLLTTFDEVTGRRHDYASPRTVVSGAVEGGRLLGARGALALTARGFDIDRDGALSLLEARALYVATHSPDGTPGLRSGRSDEASPEQLDKEAMDLLTPEFAHDVCKDAGVSTALAPHTGGEPAIPLAATEALLRAFATRGPRRLEMEEGGLPVAIARMVAKAHFIFLGVRPADRAMWAALVDNPGSGSRRLFFLSVATTCRLIVDQSQREHALSLLAQLAEAMRATGAQVSTALRTELPIAVSAALTWAARHAPRVALAMHTAVRTAVHAAPTVLAVAAAVWDDGHARALVALREAGDMAVVASALAVRWCGELRALGQQALALGASVQREALDRAAEMVVNPPEEATESDQSLVGTATGEVATAIASLRGGEPVRVMHDLAQDAVSASTGVLKIVCDIGLAAANRGLELARTIHAALPEGLDDKTIAAAVVIAGYLQEAQRRGSSAAQTGLALLGPLLQGGADSAGDALERFSDALSRAVASMVPIATAFVIGAAAQLEQSASSMAPAVAAAAQDALSNVQLAFATLADVDVRAALAAGVATTGPALADAAIMARSAALVAHQALRSAARAGAEIAPDLISQAHRAAIGLGPAAQALQTLSDDVAQTLVGALSNADASTFARAMQQASVAGLDGAKTAEVATRRAYDTAQASGRALLPLVASAGGAAVSATETAGRVVLAALRHLSQHGVPVAAEVLQEAQDAAMGALAMSPQAAKAAAGVLAQGMDTALPDDLAQHVMVAITAAHSTGAQGYAAMYGAVSTGYARAVSAGRNLAPVAALLATAASMNAAAAFAAAVPLARAGVKAVGEHAATLAGAGAAVASIAGPASLAAAQTAVGAAAGAAGAAARVTVDAGQDFFESGLVRGVGSRVVSWGDSVQEIYATSREVAAAALLAAAGVGAAAMDFLKLEIVRDVYQMVSLVLASIASEASKLARAVWGNLSGLISLDISFVVPSIPPSVIYVLLGIIGAAVFIFLIWAMCASSGLTPDAIRQGHEAKTWSQIAKERPKTVKAIGYALVLCTSLYLPLSRSAFQILACDPFLRQALNQIDSKICSDPAGGVSTDSGCCAKWNPFGIFVFLAYFILVIITIVVPIFIFRLIQRNKPTGSPEDPTITYNEDGDPVPYSDELYHRDVTTDVNQQACPFQSLYKGYERRWAYYKVVVMVFKLLLALPVIVLANHSTAAQGFISALVLAVYAVISVRATPFVDPQADVMDMAGRVSTAVTCLLATFGLDSVWKSSSTLMGVLINIVQFANAGILLTYTLLSFRSFRNKIKSCTGVLTVNDVVKDIEARPTQIMPHWNIYREVRSRVWYPFWNGLLVQGCGGAVAERLIELQAATGKYGIKRVREHFRGMDNPETRRLRKYASDELEGVDVYFDGDVHDGKNDNPSGFGKMYLVPYPFHAVFVADSSSDYAFIWTDRFDAFAKRNMDADVQAKRQLRLQLRALSGQQVRLDFDRVESRTVEDGTEQYTDNEGKTQTRTVYSTIKVHMFYHNGTLRVAKNDKTEWAAGFQVSLAYFDGHGEGVAPRTGRRVTFQNESATVGHNELGITHAFELTPRLSELLLNTANQRVWETRLPEVLQQRQAYRESLAKDRAEKEGILSSSFWIYVYYNMDLTRPDLEDFLRTSETNLVLQRLPDDHRAGLDILYQKMAFLRSHPCSMLWYTTWDAVWDCNKDLPPFKQAEALLNPKFSSSIAYQPMTRTQLDQFFVENQLTAGHLRHPKKFVNDAFCDVLFRLMEIYNQAFKEGRRGTTARSGDSVLTPEELA